MKYIGK